MSKQKINDIEGRYEYEIQGIKNRLQHLEDGRIYEITGWKQDGNLATNVQKLRKQLNDLLTKIEYQSPSDFDKMDELFE
ncbi:hypothetical protein CEY16_13930 [Halalkalibacillus sediminis]|uniref:Uncharacterized protein n=1 Tax=Halalkalibacillus sediminis TaxID=2018042 RepID=A0A2I0QRE7_9BACI|nr:hypothetical protein [Halalkalibacillus sediminis]PKR76902.1 hypothetical protein CEY16_13930 [Halalkalibacillus sediminis]